jgi:hypothetical protein
MPADLDSLDNTDPAAVLPIAAAEAHLKHWWREPVAGALALGIGAFDSWHFGRDAGLTSSLDEILIIGGVVLIAGSRRLFGDMPGPGGKQAP